MNIRWCTYGFISNEFKISDIIYQLELEYADTRPVEIETRTAKVDTLEHVGTHRVFKIK